MAVSLSEGQSLVLLLREAGSVLGTEALALLQVENGATIAATAAYTKRLRTASPHLSSGLQMMRFLNNSRTFSPAQVSTPVATLVMLCCIHDIVNLTCGLAGGCASAVSG